MGKKSESTGNQGVDLMALAGEITATSLSNRKGGGRVTYLDRFVKNLLDENGQPTDPKTRHQIITEIAVEMATEKREADIEAGKADSELDFTKNEDGAFNSPDDVKEFKTIAKKVKNQVAAAIANNQNSTSVSFNEAYKDVWMVTKHEGGKVALAPVEAAE